MPIKIDAISANLASLLKLLLFPLVLFGKNFSRYGQRKYSTFPARVIPIDIICLEIETPQSYKGQ